MWWFIKSQWWSSFSSQSLSNSFEPKNTFFFHFTSSFFFKVIYIYTWNYFIVPQIFTILKYNRWWYATLLHLISSSSFDKISYILWLLKENSRKTFFFFFHLYIRNFLGFYSSSQMNELYLYCSHISLFSTSIRMRQFYNRRFYNLFNQTQRKKKKWWLCINHLFCVSLKNWTC